VPVCRREVIDGQRLGNSSPELATENRSRRVGLLFEHVFAYGGTSDIHR
jgi:hypothetical protein